MLAPRFINGFTWSITKANILRQWVDPSQFPPAARSVGTGHRPLQCSTELNIYRGYSIGVLDRVIMQLADRQHTIHIDAS